MKVIEQTTRIVNDNQIDLNYLQLQLYHSPMVMATRESQIHRVKAWIDINDYPEFPVIGWWDLLIQGYLCKNGLVESHWRKHDVVIFLDKNRCSDKKIYSTIFEIIRAL